MRATAAVFRHANKPFEIRQFELSPPPAGHALVQMLASGICGTDIHIAEGKLALPDFPMVIGHEFVGRVSAISAADAASSGLAQGDHVIVNVVKTCGHCYLCERGESATCLNLGVTYFVNPDDPPHLFGGYADHTYAPLTNCIKLSSGVPPHTIAVFACAGPTVINAIRCCGGLDLASVRTLVVQGLGPIGLFAVLYAKAHGVRNIVGVSTGRNAKRAELAKSLGATHLLSTSATSASDRVAAVRALSDNIGADCVLEASGNPEAFNEGLDMLRNRGAYLVPGLYSDRGEISIKPHLITFKALQIIGAAQYTLDHQRAYVDFVAARPELWPLIDSVCTHEWAVEQVNEAIATAQRGESIKALFVNRAAYGAPRS